MNSCITLVMLVLVKSARNQHFIPRSAAPSTWRTSSSDLLICKTHVTHVKQKLSNTPDLKLTSTTVGAENITEVAALEQLQHSISYFDFYIFIKMSARDLHVMKIGKPYN